MCIEAIFTACSETEKGEVSEVVISKYNKKKMQAKAREKAGAFFMQYVFLATKQMRSLSFTTE